MLATNQVKLATITFVKMKIQQWYWVNKEDYNSLSFEEFTAKFCDIFLLAG